jgi:hypothetical protein
MPNDVACTKAPISADTATGRPGALLRVDEIKMMISNRRALALLREVEYGLKLTKPDGTKNHDNDRLIGVTSWLIKIMRDLKKPGRRPAPNVGCIENITVAELAPISENIHGCLVGVVSEAVDTFGIKV